MTTRVSIRRHSSGAFVGALTLGCPGAAGVGDTDGDGVITIGAFGDTQADALMKASTIAEHIASDPIMQAILPPGTMAAIVATKKLAGAAKRGSRFFRHVWKKFHGPGIHRVAKALHDEAMKHEGVSDAEVGAFWGRVKRLAKKAAKYSAPGLVYMAAKYGAKKSGLVKSKPKRRPPPVAPQEDDDQDEQEDPDMPMQSPDAPTQSPRPDNGDEDAEDAS